MTVAEAQERVTAREFAEWQAFYRLDPFGEYRADYRMGLLIAATLNLWKDKGDEPARPEDFMPKFGAEAAALELETETAPQAGSTDQEFTAAMLAVGKANNGDLSPA
jgi:hypothetical protein